MSVKILRIIARLNIGGPARNAVLLTKELSIRSEGRSTNDEGRKYESVLVCGEVNRHEGDMMYIARENGIEPVIIPELGSELSFMNDWLAFWKIYRIICREKPDIVHTHTAKAGALGRLAALLYNVIHGWFKVKGERCRVVHTFHGHVLHSYFGKAKSLFFIWIERILAIFTDRLIAVSETLKDELVRRFHIAPEKKFSVIELGFELDELLELPIRDSQISTNVGIVGRLTAVKNHKMLLRVAKRVGHRARFTIIGGGELESDLRKYARDLEVDDILDFVGWMKDLKGVYGDIDIVALTSINEGTPVSIIEAMAAAKPVIATRVGGVSDVVQDKESGYLVNSNDDDAFTDRLLELIKDPEKRKRFGRYGRELVRRRFSREKLITNVEGLYRSLLNRDASNLT